MNGIKTDLDERRVMVTADIGDILSSNFYTIQVPPGAVYWRIDKGTSQWQNWDLTLQPPAAVADNLHMKCQVFWQDAASLESLEPAEWTDYEGTFTFELKDGTAIASNMQLDKAVSITDAINCITAVTEFTAACNTTLYGDPTKGLSVVLKDEDGTKHGPWILDDFNSLLSAAFQPPDTSSGSPDTAGHSTSGVPWLILQEGDSPRMFYLLVWGLSTDPGDDPNFLRKLN
jgi:hypothetical protein